MNEAFGEDLWRGGIRLSEIGRPAMIDTSNKEIQSDYDFVVVGAGAAGSVLAAELSASGAQVLLIESGGPDDGPTIANPSIWFYNVASPLDYHLPINPSPRLNNRKFNMALGHVLGGGSSINAMVWMRGMQRDYDGWAKNGASGWAFADVLPVFKKQEDWEGGANEWRGSGAPYLFAAQKILLPQRLASSKGATRGARPFGVLESKPAKICRASERICRTMFSSPASCSSTKPRCRPDPPTATQSKR